LVRTPGVIAKMYELKNIIDSRFNTPVKRKGKR